MKLPFGRGALPVRLARRRQRRPSEAELDLRKSEIGLLRRQTLASWAMVFSTILLSTALLTLTYCQWRTAESTAAVERAKARPHFRIAQENQDDELGFLPRRFTITADGGASDALRASAKSIMAIIYVSRDLNLSGACLASFVNFYGWTNDALSFELNDAAGRLMNLSRRPDPISDSYIRMRPVWVLVDVDYLDIFGEAGQQHLLLAEGRPAPLTPANIRMASRADMELHLGVDPRGNVVIHRLDADPLGSNCANALRVMGRIPWIHIARPDEPPQDHAVPFVAAPLPAGNVGQ